MRRTQLRFLLPAVVAVGMVPFVSCDDGPTAPGPRNPAPPPGSTPATTVGVEVSAPASLAPGSSARLTARALRSDGSRLDVTATAQWSSGNTRVLEVGSDGTASARDRGDARVTARYEGRSSSVTVFVLPDGTFRLTGQITESGLPVSGVRLEVISGTGQGLTANTGFNGEYALHGVAGPITIHGKKEGFVNLVRTLEADSHLTLHMQMSLETPRTPLAGPYTLTLTAGACAAALPEEARRRVYDAVVEQSGAALTVRLSGADFILTSGRGSSFRGVHLPDDRVNFSIGESSYYYYFYSAPQEDLVERLGGSSTFVVNGGVLAVLDSDRNIPGVVHGTFGVSSRTSFPFWPYAVNCFSTAHRFELRRR